MQEQWWSKIQGHVMLNLCFVYHVFRIGVFSMHSPVSKTTLIFTGKHIMTMRCTRLDKFGICYQVIQVKNKPGNFKQETKFTRNTADIKSGWLGVFSGYPEAAMVG
jgi:hypothetical protein